jgi:uncharacterized protein (DUF488 family)
MLRRQRTTLALLYEAKQRVSATQLFKLMFLLSQETFLGRDEAFYEFLPHKYGPYSFALNRELEALGSQGYIQENHAGSMNTYGVTPLGTKEQRSVDSDTNRAVRFIYEKYGQLGIQPLLRDVYSRYPWYSTRSELENLIPQDVPKRVVAPPAVYTMGYEERSVDGFFDRLLRVGIKVILDVRANPVSRKYGFAKKSLGAISGKLGLTYEHWPQLGIPSEKRQGVETPSEFKQLFGYYDRVILPKVNADVRRMADQMQQTPSVLVCMERQAHDCHRSHLAKVLSEASGLSVVDL